MTTRVTSGPQKMQSLQSSPAAVTGCSGEGQTTTQSPHVNN